MAATALWVDPQYNHCGILPVWSNFMVILSPFWNSNKQFSAPLITQSCTSKLTVWTYNCLTTIPILTLTRRWVYRRVYFQLWVEMFSLTQMREKPAFCQEFPIPWIFSIKSAEKLEALTSYFLIYFEVPKVVAHWFIWILIASHWPSTLWLAVLIAQIMRN